MPIMPVPAGATPGVLDQTTLLSLEKVCNVGSLAGTADGSVSAWVQVSIVPAGPVTPDSAGRFFHVCIEFAQPAEWIGKRRREVPGWATKAGPGTLKLECDPGTYWIGTWAGFYATGGTPGDLYDITMTVTTSQQQSDARLAADDPPFYQVDVFEPACKFRLTSVSTASVDEPNVLLAGPLLPAHHTKVKLIQGIATWGGVPFTSANGLWVPLNAPVTVGTNTIYQTGGRV